MAINQFENLSSIVMPQVVSAINFQQSSHTVGALPNATVNIGVRTVVSDATAIATGNFGATVVGGGANLVPVYSDGVNWRIG